MGLETPPLSEWTVWRSSALLRTAPAWDNALCLVGEVYYDGATIREPYGMAPYRRCNLTGRSEQNREVFAMDKTPPRDATCTRRQMLRTVGAAGLLTAFPTVVPSSVFGKGAPSNRITDRSRPGPGRLCNRPPIAGRP